MKDIEHSKKNSVKGKKGEKVGKIFVDTTEDAV